MEYGYPITCGGCRAVLLFKKFVCPGINVRCVKVPPFWLVLYGVCFLPATKLKSCPRRLQFNGQLISPKQFVHLAGKATLKDWKRAIRLGGVMLR